MRAIVFVKKVNNTELGKGNTNDTYLLIPNEVNLDDFMTVGVATNFKYVLKNENYNLRFTIGREKRIVGLGPFFRKYKLNAGDEVVLTKVVHKDNVIFEINIIKYDNRMLIQKSNSGYELLNENCLERFESKDLISTNGENIHIEFFCKKRKRKDSPSETSYYTVNISNKDISGTYPNKGMLELELIENKVNIKIPSLWKKMVVETENNDE